MPYYKIFMNNKINKVYLNKCFDKNIFLFKTYVKFVNIYFYIYW